MTGRKRYRSMLFVPGDRTDRIASAPGRGADAVIVDLEDAVAADAKERARDGVVDLLAAGGVAGPVMVRVNSAGTAWFADDVAALAPVFGRLDALVLPMASPEAVVALHDAVAATRAEAPPFVAIAETAAAILDARAVATASPQVTTLMFGVADLSAELGVTSTADGAELAHARSHLVLASAAAGVLPPIDGPYLNLDDPAGLTRSTRVARELGFGGKATIHPAQIAAVHAEFSISEDQLRWAREVVEVFDAATASGSGVARLGDGTFIDEPIARRARDLISAAAGPDRADVR